MNAGLSVKVVLTDGSTKDATLPGGPITGNNGSPYGTFPDDAPTVASFEGRVCLKTSSGFGYGPMGPPVYTEVVPVLLTPV